MPTWITQRARPLSFIAVAVVLLAAGLITYAVSTGGAKKHATIYFPSTIGIYKGTSVRVLGVPVGKVTAVKPVGTYVEVKVEYRANLKLPADVGVVQVAPSIVSDRFLQFAPTYTSGPEFTGGTIQADKTLVPVELDQIFGSLNSLNVALGPNGANKDGALKQLIDVGASNLQGNGAQFNATLKGFSAAINTLANSRDALFGTITSLQKFTTTLATDDGGVRTINQQLAQVSGQLAAERGDLGAALANLATALTQVQSFVADNKDVLTHDLATITSVTGGLVSEQQAIKQILDEGPDALYNLVLAFNPHAQTCGTDGTCSYGALSTRADNTSDQGGLVCAVLTGALANVTGGASQVGTAADACKTLAASAGGSSTSSKGSSKGSTKTPTTPTVPTVPTPSTGGLLGGIGKALGGNGGSTPSTGTGGSGRSSSGGGLLGGLLKEAAR